MWRPMGRQTDRTLYQTVAYESDLAFRHIFDWLRGNTELPRPDLRRFWQYFWLHIGLAEAGLGGVPAGIWRLGTSLA